MFSISKDSNQFVHIRLSACLPSFTSKNAFTCVMRNDQKINGCILCPRAHIDSPKIWFAFEKCMKIKKKLFILLSLTDKMIDSILLVSLCFILSAAWKLRFFSRVGDRGASIRMYINILIFFCLLVRYLSISLLIFILFLDALQNWDFFSVFCWFWSDFDWKIKLIRKEWEVVSDLF